MKFKQGAYLVLSWASISSAAVIDAKPGLGLRKFSSAVIFGDSYTDSGLRNYQPDEDGNIGQPSNKASTGGRVWPQYVQQYAGVNTYDYAVSGACCTYIFAPGRRNGIKEDQIPTFLSNKAGTNPVTGAPALSIPQRETVYAVWIGTNDLGNAAFFGEQQPRGMAETAFTDCVFEQLQRLYTDAGARNFVLMNLAPLDFLPQYALPENGGVGDTSPFYPEKLQYNPNITQISEKMRQTVALVNAVFEYKTPYEVKVADSFRGSSFAIYDTNKLLSDMWHDPASYFNGTAPLNVTSSIRQCGTACADLAVRDSYMWYDELHPSEQTDRVIAREFVKVVQGGSSYATYYFS